MRPGGLQGTTRSAEAGRPAVAQPRDDDKDRDSDSDSDNDNGLLST